MRGRTTERRRPVHLRYVRERLTSRVLSATTIFNFTVIINDVRYLVEAARATNYE